MQAAEKMTVEQWVPVPGFDVVIPFERLGIFSSLHDGFQDDVIR